MKCIPKTLLTTDNRIFKSLNSSLLNLEKPFDIRFRQAIINTIEFLMGSYFQILYDYNESDEISLLFIPTLISLRSSQIVNGTHFWLTIIMRR